MIGFCEEGGDACRDRGTDGACVYVWGTQSEQWQRQRRPARQGSDRAHPQRPLCGGCGRPVPRAKARSLPQRSTLAELRRVWLELAPCILIGINDLCCAVRTESNVRQQQPPYAGANGTFRQPSGPLQRGVSLPKGAQQLLALRLNSAGLV